MSEKEYWTSVWDELPQEVQSYGRTSEDVHVTNSNSGFYGVAYLAYSIDGPKWFTADNKYELIGITHWKHKYD